MNILLIRPQPHQETIGLQHVMICEPLELEYLAANIEHEGASVEIIDLILEKKPLEYFIQKHQPDIVGISGYITHVGIIKDYGRRIKSIKADTTVVVGGVHAEVVPQDFVCDVIDYIVEANPIQTFNEIIKRRGEKSIPGTYGPSQVNVKEPAFPYRFPDRKSVAKYRKQYYYMFHNPCSLIKTSFGCPYNCSFCFCKEITNGKYYTRDIDSVIQELKEIPEEEIYIVDDDFLFSRERILAFCQKLKEQNIQKHFLVYGRADFIYKNEDVIKAFREVGLRAVIVGLESFKKADLDKYNKGTSIMENEAAIQILKRQDVEVYGTFILDMDFSKEDFQNLYGWIRKLDITFVNLQPLTPLPGTDIYESYEKDFIIQKQEYEKWDLAHLVLAPTKMSIRRYYFEMIKLYYKITMNPKGVMRLIRKYGLKDVLKLSIGSSRVTQQYIGKILRGK